MLDTKWTRPNELYSCCSQLKNIKPDYPDFAGFSRPFQAVFTGFSWFFPVFFTVSGVTIFANLEVAPSIFQALDIFGGGTLLG